MKLHLLIRYAVTVGGGLFSTALYAQDFNFLLSGSQESPTAVANGSAGYAITTLSGNIFSYEIHYTGISNLSAIHFHGPAGVGENALPVVGLTAGSSPIIGSANLTDGQVSDLLAGNWYLNLHSPSFPAGEVRGQVVDQLGFAPNTILSGSQEVPFVATQAGGAALVTFNPNINELAWNIAYEGLTTAVTMMHFHGPAAAGVNAGVRVNMEPISGLASGSAGSIILSDAFAAEVLSGEWYINVHTGAVGSGELRGQVTPTIVPEPSTYAALVGLLGLAVVLLRRRN
jgi:hypothetical protein